MDANNKHTNSITITEDMTNSSAVYYHIARYLTFSFWLEFLKSEIFTTFASMSKQKNNVSEQGMQKTSHDAASHPPANHIFPNGLFKLVQNSHMGNVRTKQSWMNGTTQRSANTKSHSKWYSRKHSDSRVLGKHISLGIFSQNCPSAWAVLVSQSGFLDTLHKAWQNNYKGSFPVQTTQLCFLPAPPHHVRSRLRISAKKNTYYSEQLVFTAYL